MMSRLLALPIFLLVSSAFAQFSDVSPTQTGRLAVQVTPTQGQRCTETQVTVISSSGARVTDTYANPECTAEFFDLPAGNYRVVASAPGSGDASSETFAVSPRVRQDVEVAMKRGSTALSATATAALVSAADFNIPKSARKTFDKANDLMAKRKFTQALDRLNEAIAIYPRYAEAYNNLGVVYNELGNARLAREALQRAIAIDDHQVRAMLGLARMDVVDRDFIHAESLLGKAIAADPGNGAALVLLAYAQFSNQQYDQALATCHRAHSLPQTHHAFVHYIAADAWEKQNHPANAMAELQIFLTEEQSGPRAEAARKKMTTLQAELH